MKSPVNLIAALGRRGQIGIEGRLLPWDNPRDLSAFRTITNGGIVIVGRRTYDQMPPLPGRLVANFDRHHVPRQMIKRLQRQYVGWPIWISGGAATYCAFADLVDGVKIMSAIDYDNDPADDSRHVFFPFDSYGIRWFK